MNAVMALAAPHSGHMRDAGWNDDMWIWGSLIMVSWLGLAVVVTWLVVRSINGRAAAARESTGAGRARDIIDERYAKGELSTEEYEERRARLARLN
jgi:putative membrane protein